MNDELLPALPESRCCDCGAKDRDPHHDDCLARRRGGVMATHPHLEGLYRLADEFDNGSVTGRAYANKLRHALAALPGGGVEYEYEVWQDDNWQAGGSTTTLEAAESEVSHYALTYGQDGPVEVKYFERRQLLIPTPNPHEADRNG